MLSDKNKKKSTDEYMAGLGSGDSYVKLPQGKPMPKVTKIEISEAKPVQQEVPKKEVVSQPVVQKAPEKKPEPKFEPPKIVIPKFIKKDAALEKEITKIIQEVPKEELERILKPTQSDKNRLAKMDFQTRSDMSEEEKKDFIEQIAKREPEKEIAEMNGALVWKWQQNRKSPGK